MALKAGYKGIKKSVLETLMSLAGSVVIKSIGDGLTLSEAGELSANVNDVGDGLTLSEAGELSADIDTSTMEFKEGKLAAKITSGYKKDLLYGSSTITYPASQLADYTLAHDIKDYDEIHIISGWTADSVNCIESWVIDAKLLDGMSAASQQKDYQFVFPCNSGVSTGQWIRLSKGSADNIIHALYDSSVGIYQIYGVKF